MIKCITNEPYDEAEAYKNSAKSHSKLINFNNQIVSYYPYFVIHGSYSSDKSYNTILSESTELTGGVNLKFSILIPNTILVKKVEWMICNAGYEARKAQALRGKKYKQTDISKEINDGKLYI